MLILGIETSCDETSVSLLEVKQGKIKVLTSVASSQVRLHAKYGGVVPSLAAREHVRNINHVMKLALASQSLNDIDLIAVTRGPGLVSSLLVGAAFAQTLAWKFNRRIVGVNHLEGHIYSNWLKPVGVVSNFKFQISKKFPILNLIVSGGHTELVLMTGYGRYRVVGETLDDAAGEAFDKIARILGLGYPGGPIISELAERALPAPAIKLPRPMLTSRNYDFSFAGLKTAVLYLVRDLTKNKKRLTAQLKAAIAAEAQQAIVDVLVAKTLRAAKQYCVRTIALSGGVSANKLLRSELARQTKQNKIKFFKPEMEYTTDNAAMIAAAGYFNYKARSKKPSRSLAPAKLRLGKQKTDWQSVRVDANLSF